MISPSSICLLCTYRPINDAPPLSLSFPLAQTMKTSGFEIWSHKPPTMLCGSFFFFFFKNRPLKNEPRSHEGMHSLNHRVLKKLLKKDKLCAAKLCYIFPSVLLKCVSALLFDWRMRNALPQFCRIYFSTQTHTVKMTYSHFAFSQSQVAGWGMNGCRQKPKFRLQ